MNTFNTYTFNSRQTYLEYRLHWKLRYFDAISDVRKKKAAVKEANRVYTPKRISDLWDSYYDVKKARKVVQELCNELSAARELAASQRNKS